MKHQPTIEQQTICKLATTGENLLIEALAGTGKTSTGKLIAEAVPNKTCLSIFFNKKNAEEGMAQKDRPSNMFYSTIHSLCYRQIVLPSIQKAKALKELSTKAASDYYSANESKTDSKELELLYQNYVTLREKTKELNDFGTKLNNFLLFEDIDTSLLKKLLLNEEAYQKGEFNKELGKLQRVVLDCMKLWQQSDAMDCFTFVSTLHNWQLGFKTSFEQITLEDLTLDVITDEKEKQFRRECIAGTCELLWKAMIDASHKAKLTHDTYVKLFQLEGRTFTQVYDVANKMFLSIDLLILDEVQDSNAVTLSIFNNQTHLQRIACGDKNQNLYAWRGAMNDFSRFASWNKASLTESFRFGQAIADLANKVLALPIRNTKLRLVGRGTDVGTGQTAILCRTNASVLQTVFSLLLQDGKVACVSKFSEMESMMYHVFAVLNEQVPKFPAASLKSFDTKEKMWQAIESNQELAQVYKLAKMISEAKGGLYSGLKYLKENLCEQNKADFVVSTIHASKGLGFTKVVIGEDFLVPTSIDGCVTYEFAIEEMFASNSMTSLLYVAITRAMKEVVLPSYLEGVL